VASFHLMRDHTVGQAGFLVSNGYSSPVCW